jgi:hypothetical protein
MYIQQLEHFNLASVLHPTTSICVESFDARPGGLRSLTAVVGGSGITIEEEQCD